MVFRIYVRLCPTSFACMGAWPLVSALVRLHTTLIICARTLPARKRTNTHTHTHKHNISELHTLSLLYFPLPHPNTMVKTQACTHEQTLTRTHNITIVRTRKALQNPARTQRQAITSLNRCRTETTRGIPTKLGQLSNSYLVV